MSTASSVLERNTGITKVWVLEHKHVGHHLIPSVYKEHLFLKKAKRQKGSEERKSRKDSTVGNKFIQEGKIHLCFCFTFKHKINFFHASHIKIVSKKS